MSRSILTAYDLMLYQCCPRLLWYYKSIGKSSERFFDPSVIALERAGAWLVDYIDRLGRIPAESIFDDYWGRQLAKLSLDLTTIKSTWTLLRHLRAALAETMVIQGRILSRTLSKGAILNLPLSGISLGENTPYLISFRAVSRKDYDRDLKTRLELLAAGDLLDIDRAIIWNLCPQEEDLRATTLSLVNARKLKKEAQSLISAVALGPHYPIYQCKRYECEHWNRCKWG